MQRPQQEQVPIHRNPFTSQELLIKRLESGEDVLISRFEKFCIKEKEKRKGRNPATGEELTLNGRRVVTFRCSTVLRERINRTQ